MVFLKVAFITSFGSFAQLSQSASVKWTPSDQIIPMPAIFVEKIPSGVKSPASFLKNAPLWYYQKKLQPIFHLLHGFEWGLKGNNLICLMIWTASGLPGGQNQKLRLESPISVKKNYQEFWVPFWGYRALLKWILFGVEPKKVEDWSAELSVGSIENSKTNTPIDM